MNSVKKFCGSLWRSSLHLHLIRFLGLIVPRRLRFDWRQEWEAELRWRETMLYLKANGVSNVYEIGAGRVLTGIARRFDGIAAQSIGTPEELEAAAAVLAA